MMGHVDAKTTKPVAIRIQRPYDTEAELLEAEAATLTRSTLLLLGAKSRPVGTTLRFEWVLRSGTPVIRGEGKVQEYQDETRFGPAGLLVKFSRLDARSKKFLEETFGPQSALSPNSVPPTSISPASLAPLSLAEVDAPFASPSTTDTHVDAHADGSQASSPPEAVPVQLPSQPPERSVRYSEPVTATHATLLDDARERAMPSVAVPSGAQGALERLRQRGRALTQEQREAILGPRRSS